MHIVERGVLGLLGLLSTSVGMYALTVIPDVRVADATPDQWVTFAMMGMMIVSGMIFLHVAVWASSKKD